MTIETILNAPALRGCIESPRSVGEWWACCPHCADGRRRLLIRSYSNGGATLHCMGRCREGDILALLGLTIHDRRGRDGLMPDAEPGWYNYARRSSRPTPPQGEQ